MKKCKWLALLMLVPIVLTSCDILDLGFLAEKDPIEQYQEYFEGITSTRGEIKVETVDLSNYDFEYSERDLSTEYDGGSATRIVFADSGSTVYGKGAETEGSDVVISAAGTYIISGSATSALLTVKASGKDAVHLVLAGLTLAGKSGTAIDIRSAGSVLLTLAGENSLSNSSEYKPSALDRQTNAVILSKGSLSINGIGSLSVVGNRAHGILSQGELILTGGELNVRTTQAGLVGETCVKLGGGKIRVLAEEEGVLSGKVFDENSSKTEASTDEVDGYVYISGGFLDVTSKGDAIRAESLILVEDGVLDLMTGVQMDEVQKEEETAETLPDFWEIFEVEDDEATEEERPYVVFSDGLHATSDVLIYGGTLAIDASNRAVSSGQTLCIDGGQLWVRSIRDGLYASGAIGISDGILLVESGRNGIEGESIDVSGSHIYMGKANKGVFTKGAFRLSGGVLAVAGAKELPLDFGVATVTGGVLAALGNADVAREFFPTEEQGVILCQFDSQNSGYPLAICDNDGTLLLSIEGKLAYSMAYLSMPEIQRGDAFTLTSGGFAPSADRYGLALGGEPLIGSEPLALVTVVS